MPRLSVCPQHHVWTSAGHKSDVAMEMCPVCGMQGRPAAVVLTNTDAAVETIPPAMLPPVVDDVTLVQARSPVADDCAADSDAGAVPTVPGYEIVRELGRGGMGVVYLARDRRLKRLVALKMVLAGAHADPETRARFRREAEAIARLQHPGIVQIHDVGEHHGRPFLSLEFVEGSNLAYQMAWGAVAPRTAATLVERLARIVQHAHERGIVHRDLTPRNVLLATSDSAQGIYFQPAGPWFEPKITDFGLAKELDTDLGQTQTGVIVGTPAYMSPEQAQGRPRDIGACTDIYALGSILYELLTGRPPFMGETGHETLRQIVENDPPPPTRLQNRVPRDLETIALKCLEKERRKRYATASDLADDLHRYLTSQPIRARPISRRERAWKWMRRHPAAAALLTVIAISLGALLTGGLVYNAQLRQERDRAETNLELAMRAVDEMLSEVGEKQLATEPRMEEKRRALLTKALALHREFMKERRDDSRVSFSTALAYRRLADVLRLLEQHDESLANYERALALLNQLRETAPEDPEYRREIAYCRNFQGEVHRVAGKLREAKAAYQEASHIEGELARQFPDDLKNRQVLARTLNNLGIVLRESGELAEAERQLRRSADLLLELSKEQPQNPRHRELLGRAYLNLGTAIPETERFGEVQDAYDRAISFLRPLTENHPELPEYRHELAAALNNMGNLLASADRFEEAQKMHALAKARFAVLAADFPNVPIYRQELANTCNSIGNVAYLRMDYEGALSNWSESRKVIEGLLEKHPGMLAYQGDLGMAHLNLGLAQHKLGQHSQARAHLEKSIEILEKVIGGGPVSYQKTLQFSYHNLAEVLVVSGDHAAAATAARQLAGATPPSADHPYNAACFLARCIPLAECDKKLSPEKQRELAQSYAEASIAAIRDALDRGFNNAEKIRTDQATVLKPIASRPDFRALIQQVAGN